MSRTRDAWILVIGAFVRAVAVGYLGIVLAIHITERGLSEAVVGDVVTAGLAGAATAALLVTVIADRISRRLWLAGLSALSALGAAGAAFAAAPLAIGAAAFVGMLNGMGRDRGAAPILDQAALPATTDDAGRTRAFALYSLAQDIGHAAGALAAWLANVVTGEAAMLGYAAVAALLVPWYLALSPAVESGRRARPEPLRPESRRTVARISALFLLDAIGGGFLSSALLSVFFRERFGASIGDLALLFGASRVLNAFSHLGAAWLARRIGLVPTMVFTHLPSSLLLVTVPFAPSYGIAALLFLLREGLVEMDVPTRQSYVMAVVAPDERTRAAGITQLVRLGGWAVGPIVAGRLMGADQLVAPLVVAAAMKIAYDLLLWFAFRRLRPPEEVSAP